MAAQFIQTFTFHEAQTIRTFVDTDGEIWFCRKDVLDILGLDRTTNLLDYLDQKGVVINHSLTQGGKQKLVYINEPNLYRIIFKSTKPEAKNFQDWVFNEVLPALRKHGHYEVKEVKPVKTDELSDKDMFLIKDALYKLSSKFTFDQAMRNACWFSLRALTGVKSPAKLRYSDLDVIVEELKRISYITCCYMDAKRNAEQEICRKILRVQGSSKELAEILGNMITDAASDEAIAKLSKSDRYYLNNEIETVRQQIEGNKTMRTAITC